MKEMEWADYIPSYSQQAQEEDPAKEDPAKEDPAKGGPAKGDAAKEGPAKGGPAKEGPAKSQNNSDKKKPVNKRAIIGTTAVLIAALITGYWIYRNSTDKMDEITKVLLDDQPEQPKNAPSTDGEGSTTAWSETDQAPWETSEWDGWATTKPHSFLSDNGQWGARKQAPINPNNFWGPSLATGIRTFVDNGSVEIKNLAPVIKALDAKTILNKTISFWNLKSQLTPEAIEALKENSDIEYIDSIPKEEWITKRELRWNAAIQQLSASNEKK